jgi:acyl-CoA synthetase (AMP-forming)/AMP-acid ligase II
MRKTHTTFDPKSVFLHDAILATCRRFPEKTALVDASCGRHFTYAEYGETVERLARGLVTAGLCPGEIVAICLPNSWEFAVAYHAATLAGGFPTPMNPTYREREIRFQLENSGAVFLVTDAPMMQEVNLGRLPALRRVFTTRAAAPETEGFADLLRPTSSALPEPTEAADVMLAALPYSSGTTGLPKGVMLSHHNLVANIYQVLAPDAGGFTPDDVMFCFLPLYHIFGLNVALNTILIAGGTLVLMPRFNVQQIGELALEEGFTTGLMVPPALNALAQAAEKGEFPRDHRIQWVKSGAAPLPPDVARRFSAATGIIVNQGYGMTEASPVTHLGYLDTERNRPESIGHPLAETECRVMGDDGNEAGEDAPGELVMRGPQFMRGYWKEPQATASVLRDGWYWSGDVVRRDADAYYHVLDRRKEMIKYKGFPVAPAEVEAVLMEHPGVRDCGVIARPNDAAGEIPCAFVVLREGTAASVALEKELCGFVAERLTYYKQPREIHFIDSVPRTPSGKILRRELKNLVI